MRSAKGQRALRTGLYGLRTAWDVVGDGEFFCQDCGGDRNYRRLTGKHRFTVLGVPLVRRGGTAPVVECADCRARFGTEALEHPTTTRFSAMLREAVHTVALAVLASGGTPAPPWRPRRPPSARPGSTTARRSGSSPSWRC